jgi:hypothetical protein
MKYVALIYNDQLVGQGTHCLGSRGWGLVLGPLQNMWCSTPASAQQHMQHKSLLCCYQCELGSNRCRMLMMYIIMKMITCLCKPPRWMRVMTQPLSTPVCCSLSL